MAKKNYRPSVQARKKNEEKKLAERQEFYRAHRKQITIAAVAAVVAVLLIALLIDIFYVPAGSLPTVMGKVKNVQPTSIVREIDGRYYEFAKMETPEGYVAADYGINMSGNDQEQQLYFETTDESKPFASIFVSGVEEKNGQYMIDLLTTSNLAYSMQSPGSKTDFAGHDLKYLYAHAPVENEDGSISNYAALVMYIDTIQDSSVLVQCNSAVVPEEQLPTEEAMFEEAEKILSCLTLP